MANHHPLRRNIVQFSSLDEDWEKSIYQSKQLSDAIDRAKARVTLSLSSDEAATRKRIVKAIEKEKEKVRLKYGELINDSITGENAREKNILRLMNLEEKILTVEKDKKQIEDYIDAVGKNLAAQDVVGVGSLAEVNLLQRAKKEYGLHGVVRVVDVADPATVKLIKKTIKKYKMSV